MDLFWWCKRRFGRSLQRCIHWFGVGRSGDVRGQRGAGGAPSKSVPDRGVHRRGVRGRVWLLVALVVASQVALVPGAVADPIQTDGDTIPLSFSGSGCGFSGGVFTVSGSTVCTLDLDISLDTIPADWSAPFLVTVGVQQLTNSFCASVLPYGFPSTLWLGGQTVVNSGCANSVDGSSPPAQISLSTNTLAQTAYLRATSGFRFTWFAAGNTEAGASTWHAWATVTKLGDRTTENIVDAIESSNSDIIANNNSTSSQQQANDDANTQLIIGNNNEVGTAVIAATNDNTTAVNTVNQSVQQTISTITDPNVTVAPPSQTSQVPVSGPVSGIIQSLMDLMNPSTFTGCSSLRATGAYGLFVDLPCASEAGIPPWIGNIIGVVVTFIVAIPVAFLIFSIVQKLAAGEVDAALAVAKSRLEKQYNSMLEQHD